MNENYFTPVSIKNIKLHGDFATSDPSVTVVRVKNFRVEHGLAVVKCIDPKGFKEETGYEHTPELYIRSSLMLFKGFVYDFDILNWRTDNDLCRKAVEENEKAEDFGMTFAYDDVYKDMFEYDETHEYEFNLPDEILLALPVDLDEMQFGSLGEDVVRQMVSSLIWRQLIGLLPITNIREISSVQETVYTGEPELKKLREMRDFVETKIDRLFKDMESSEDGDYDPEQYEISVIVGERAFKLGDCAKEYNGLLQYIDYMISEI